MGRESQPHVPGVGVPPFLASVLRESSPISEAFVQFLWQEQCFDQTALCTTDGRPIRVLKSGQINRDAGPDFQEAEIILDDEIRSGAVELHVNLSDWKTHGHDHDPRYASVILHVALWAGVSTDETRAGTQALPTLVLAPYLCAPLDELLAWWREERSELCPLSSSNLPDERVLNVLQQLGQERLLEKIEHFSFQVQRRDLEQVGYEAILDALGYAANREPFQELGRRLPFGQVVGKPQRLIEALLFGTAGLLPAQTGEPVIPEAKEYVQHLEALWYAFPSPPTPLRTTDWKFSRLRPANYPTRRLAGMAAILAACSENSLLLRFLRLVEPLAHAQATASSVLRRLRESLMPPAEGFWVHHSRFSGQAHRSTNYLIGTSRASDIVVNVILPLLALWAGSVQSDPLRDAVQTLYDHHPSLQSNRITRQVAAWLHVPQRRSSAKIQQGMIYLYRLFCTTGLCGLCPLAQEVP